MFPIIVFLLAALTLGCGNKAAENQRVAEQKERDAKESRDYLEATTTRNAPLIAARHNLSVEVVRRILLFNEGEQTRAIEKFATNSKLELKELAPDNSALLDQLAAQENLERRTIGDVLFDNAVLNCKDKENSD